MGRHFGWGDDGRTGRCAHSSTVMNEQSGELTSNVPTWPQSGVLFKDVMQDRASLRVGTAFAFLIMGALIGAATVYTGTGVNSPILLGTSATVLLALLYAGFTEFRKRRMIKVRAPIVARAYGLDVIDFQKQMLVLAVPEVLSPVYLDGGVVWVMIREHKGTQIWSVYAQRSKAPLEPLPVLDSSLDRAQVQFEPDAPPTELHSGAAKRRT